MTKTKFGYSTIIGSVLGAMTLGMIVVMMVFTYKSLNSPVVIKKELAVEAGGPILYMNPDIANKNIGESFDVDLMLDSKSEKASATEITVTYDPTILKANSITPSGYFPILFKNGAINNGVITITLGCGPGNPKTGIGKLATINFTTIAYGDDTINYDTQTQLAVVNQTANFISSMMGTVVSVAEINPTSTITPTPLSTAVPSYPPIHIGSTTPSTSSEGSIITIFAAGTKGGRIPHFPKFKLYINNHVVFEALDVSGNFKLRKFVKYTYRSPVKVTHDQVKIAFTNDSFWRRNDDRNLMIDKIKIDGVTYQAENASVTTRYSHGSGCRSGKRRSEWLFCNGYLSF
jgi:hypothetical protein